MKKVVLASAAVVLTAMSIYAFADKSAEKNAKASTEQCPPECCNGTGRTCDPSSCEK